MVAITIDGMEYDAGEKDTVLNVAKALNIKIPTLCYHPALRPIGACRLCTVEILSRTGKAVTRLSCVLRVREGLVVRTDSELVRKVRLRAFKNLLAMAPQAKPILNLAKEYGIDLGAPPDGCVRCRLCIRVCSEIVGPGALKMDRREGKEFVIPLEGLCIGCGTCANICPTGAIKVEDREGVRTVSIRHETIGIYPLQQCDGCGRYFASQKFISHVSQRVKERHAEVKEHHAYCPTCAKLFSDRVKSLSRPLHQ